MILFKDIIHIATMSSVCDCDCVCRCERKRVESEREREREREKSMCSRQKPPKKRRGGPAGSTQQRLYFLSRKTRTKWTNCLPVCTVVAEVCGEFRRRQNSVDNKNWKETKETTIEIAEKREWEWHAELLGLIGVSAAVSLAWLLKLLKSSKFKSWKREYFYCCSN